MEEHKKSSAGSEQGRSIQSSILNQTYNGQPDAPSKGQKKHKPFLTVATQAIDIQRCKTSDHRCSIQYSTWGFATGLTILISCSYLSQFAGKRLKLKSGD